MESYLEPLYEGMFIAGNVIYLYLGLIRTWLSMAWVGPDLVRDIPLFNIWYLLVIELHIWFGAVNDQLLLRNSGAFFLVIWFFIALWDFEVLNAWALVLLISCTLVAVRYLIKTHPLGCAACGRKAVLIK
jgi:hypothetical protein